MSRARTIAELTNAAISGEVGTSDPKMRDAGAVALERTSPDAMRTGSVSTAARAAPKVLTIRALAASIAAGDRSA